MKRTSGICKRCDIIYDILDEDQNLCITCLDEWKKIERGYDSDETIEGIDWDSTNKMMPEVDFSDLEEPKKEIKIDWIYLNESDESDKPDEPIIKRGRGRPIKNFDAKVWRRNNKETIKGYSAKKVKCEICDIELRYDSMRQHNKSLKHLKRVESLEI